MSVCMKEMDMDDEENNTSNIRTIRVQQSSSEPQQQQQQQQQQLSLSSPIRIQKDISSLQSESLIDEKENKEGSKSSHFTFRTTNGNRRIGKLLKFSTLIFLGSCVEVLYRNERRCGVVKWIDNNELIQSNRLVAVEIVSKISTNSIEKFKLRSCNSKLKLKLRILEFNL
ncbi:unnamed protein product [Onchocerca flexuosa]|uniref:Uncharacterized protein n=1 Tax=Onchocerca flexuosa TaxID=387005 RepID=A0A183HRW6_9BILA|nr:unnamed protein product [Onchocerca flexuosa]